MNTKQIYIAICLWFLASCASYRDCPPELLDPDQHADKACRVDGCTIAPDFKFSSCCDAHDVAYWQGGTRAERLTADQEFRACVSEKSSAVTGWLYYSGVRLGGVGFAPTPWRWGFGWDYPRTAPER